LDFYRREKIKRKNHAVLLNCATLEYEYVPLQLDAYCLVVANCNKPHNLVESKYNVRRQELETALKTLQTVLPVRCLAEVTTKQFMENKYLLSGVVAKRIRTASAIKPASMKP
jgi:galactokinase